MKGFDGSITRSLDNGMAVDGLRYCSMDDGTRGSSLDDGVGNRPWVMEWGIVPCLME